MLTPATNRLRSSVVITTKNRKDELRVALRSALEQSCALEVLVMDDGSTDGTSEMVRAEFPQVRLVVDGLSRGYIVRRNEVAKLATGEIIFSIDDDAAFSTPHVVEQTLREFDDPKIGAVAIPYLEPHKDNRLLQQAPDRAQVWVTDRFIGTAHALRREVFLKLGGYREHLVHQGEEGDFCLRLLAAGYVVRLGRADAIHHFESPKRDFQRMDFYGHRNLILFAWQNVPLPYLFLHLMGTTLNCFRSIWRSPSRVGAVGRGIFAGYAQMFVIPRHPVTASTYRLHRRLRKSPGLNICEIELVLSPSCFHR